MWPRTSNSAGIVSTHTVAVVGDTCRSTGPSRREAPPVPTSTAHPRAPVTWMRPRRHPLQAGPQRPLPGVPGAAGLRRRGAPRFSGPAGAPGVSSTSSGTRAGRRLGGGPVVPDGRRADVASALRSFATVTMAVPPASLDAPGTALFDGPACGCCPWTSQAERWFTELAGVELEHRPARHDGGVRRRGPGPGRGRGARAGPGRGSAAGLDRALVVGARLGVAVVRRRTRPRSR